MLKGLILLKFINNSKTYSLKLQATPKCTICESQNVQLYLRLNGLHSVYACKNCSNGFTYPPPQSIPYTDEDFHAQFGFSTINDLPDQWKNSLFKQIKLIKKYILLGANILEIGCGQGLFLTQLKKEGYQVYGIEPSINASAVARNKGLNVKTGYYPEVNFNEIKLDLIIMAQVLEHVPAPMHFLKEIASLSKASYLLLIQTNYRGLVPSKQKKNWYGWVADQHFSHFTPKGIKFLASKNRLKTLKIEYSTLEHNNYWLSKCTAFIPRTGDQIHAMIKL